MQPVVAKIAQSIAKLNRRLALKTVGKASRSAIYEIFVKFFGVIS